MPQNTTPPAGRPLKDQDRKASAAHDAQKPAVAGGSQPSILNLEEVPDAVLVEGIKAGSEPHFNALYERYFSRVYAFAHSRMRSHSDAEEVSQETFVSVLTSIDKYRGQASLLSWIFGIAKNLSNNLIRKSSGQREKLGRVDPEHFIPQVSFGRGGPEEEFTFQRYAKSLRREIEGVSDWQVEIFEMRHLKDMSISEISEKTHRSSDAIRSSLYRIKKLMIEVAEIEGAERVGE